MTDQPDNDTATAPATRRIRPKDDLSAVVEVPFDEAEDLILNGGYTDAGPEVDTDIKLSTPAEFIEDGVNVADLNDPQNATEDEDDAPAPRKAPAAKKKAG